MIISNINDFLSYYENIRKRTKNVIKCIPENEFEWRPKEDSFSFGDIIRHISNIERFMYAETILGNQSSYQGHGQEIVQGYKSTLNYFDDLHKQSMNIFTTLTETNLQEKCFTPAGIKITIWKWLRSMVEHEIHHRAHIYSNLSMLGIKTPPLFGLTSEEVKESKN